LPKRDLVSKSLLEIRGEIFDPELKIQLVFAKKAGEEAEA